MILTGTPIQFQSTLPARGATDAARVASSYRDISIHAPRTGSDWICRDSSKSAHDFNPRSPHGERPLGGVQYSRENVFQSTLPARGATCGNRRRNHNRSISIHAPRTGSDLPKQSRIAFQADYFNPRSPHGERPLKIAICRTFSLFQSTLPARGATLLFIGC